VIGKAFWDIDHTPKDQFKSAKEAPGYAVWEIHPVIKVNIMTDSSVVEMHVRADDFTEWVKPLSHYSEFAAETSIIFAKYYVKIYPRFARLMKAHK
jgi:hypothetical protein